MDIIIGTRNPLKVACVKRVFPGARVKAMSVESDVPNRPVNDEIQRGAIGRVNNIHEDADMHIAIEGGLREIGGDAWLQSVAAAWYPELTDDILLGNSDLVQIPKSSYKLFQQGMPVGSIICSLKGVVPSAEFRYSSGLSAYLTDGEILREHFIMNALERLVEKTRGKTPSQPEFRSTKGSRFVALDEACIKILRKPILNRGRE